MSHQFEAGKDELLEQLLTHLKHKVPQKQATSCVEFARQFYGSLAMEDLEEWGVDDLCGAAVNFWRFVQYRKKNEIKINIYNPDFEQFGWQTTHTVIEVLCDDIPFLVDSLRLVISRMGFALHLIIHLGNLKVIRGRNNRITSVLPQHSDLQSDEILREAPILFEIDRQTDPKVLKQLHSNFMLAIEETSASVADWQAMRERIKASIDEIKVLPKSLDQIEVRETEAFLTWIENHHFTFLGVRDYVLNKSDDEIRLETVPGTGLGILRENLNSDDVFYISAMGPAAEELMLSPQILIISKTSSLANVHRDTYTDYIGIKRFNSQGEVIGERRVLGLYTAVAYNTNSKNIPFLRHKVTGVMEKADMAPGSHAGKALLNILDTLPRDDLFQASEDELLEIVMGIFYMQERRRIRMFARVDCFHRFISCLVYVPRDLFNTTLRKEIQHLLHVSFQAIDISFAMRFSESTLARIHFMIRIDPTKPVDFDFREIEKKIIEIGRTWSDELQHYLFDTFGEEQSNKLFNRYKKAFPASYVANYSPRTAVLDIGYLEKLSQQCSLVMNLNKPLSASENHFKLKIYRCDNSLPLSDILPIIENLGLRALSERPYAVKYSNGETVWVDEFYLIYPRKFNFHLDEIKDSFQEAFCSVWFRQSENDGFNQLVLAAGLSWREVAILRAYAKYFKQLSFTFSQTYIESTLSSHSEISKKMVKLFETCFSPELEYSRKERTQKALALKNAILADAEELESLDEDKIVRQYLQSILGTTRTNFYQTDADGNPHDYITLKFNSAVIPSMPKPYPMYEIYVYSPRFEGVHLRCSKVARGGLRWSDRREDFRTEILGLMKAQQVKNSVIVPSGAKGGFVAKNISSHDSREEVYAEGVECYRQFIQALLGVTDNFVEGVVDKPPQCICYDEDDPYLVVAADKGTASFSDTANDISHDYQFWLGDAFASGGSQGYDHKKMGITARGAWESVKRHFYELGHDIMKKDFTVLGVGDMSGDVFGNGMLLSKHIKLVAAFNHTHIFIDPSPNAKASFKERKRLFHLPRSNWTDYDKNLISSGGGVFSRRAKSISLSNEMKKMLGIKKVSIEPNELIKALLKMEVDLFWSAGIGTFVKAERESHADVGDRGNDAIRINARHLKCKIVAEGGNLGLTQLARVEYALSGGLVYTDFIDNSAGVHCSDNEVNIKILLDSVVLAGDLTIKQRNQLLSDMTAEVAAHVLQENFLQARSIDQIVHHTKRSLELYARYIKQLEKWGKINITFESLPSEKQLLSRSSSNKGLVAPEVAVLFCHSKLLLKEEILASTMLNDPYHEKFLRCSFPKPLQKFAEQMMNHPLRREVIATTISNFIMNEVGFNIIFRLRDETAASTATVVQAYLVARAVFDMEKIWEKISYLERVVDSKTQINVTTVYVRLLRRASRWFLRRPHMLNDLAKVIAFYKPRVNQVKGTLPEVLTERHRVQFNKYYNKQLSEGIPDDLAQHMTTTRGLFAAMDIVDIASELKLKVPFVAKSYFQVGEFLDIGWVRDHVIIQSVDTRWEVLSREGLRDDLDRQQRQLTRNIIRCGRAEDDFRTCLETWAASQEGLVQRWRDMLAKLRATSTLTYPMLFAAVRELVDLSTATE